MKSRLSAGAALEPITQQTHAFTSHSVFRAVRTAMGMACMGRIALLTSHRSFICGFQLLRLEH